MGERPEGPGSTKTSVSWTHHMPLFSEFLTKETINALVVQATIQFSNTCSQMHSNQKDSNQRQEDPCVFLKHNLLFTVLYHLAPFPMNLKTLCCAILFATVS